MKHFKTVQTRLATIPLVLFSVFLLCGIYTPHTYADENKLTLTVAPPLFQLNLQPGETWTSGIQVANGNPYNITVYAEPVLFEPTGEEGRPSFLASPGAEGQADTPDSSTLAGWITVPQGAIDIAREQTYEIPLSITVPEDASPGGHYAALLIGNRAPSGAREGGTVSVTSSIASLIFLTVAGEVEERGRIRDFVTEQSIYETPEARLSLRFENQGNVHLLPQGDITIYNMFGRQRGYIPINHQGHYGNVLPGSIRKYTFTWKADAGAWDIGRYRAEATLGYGKDSKDFANATIYFYILPFVPLLQILGGGIAFLIFIGWALRAYVRRALFMETIRLRGEIPQEVSEKSHKETQSVHKTPQLKLNALIRPIQSGMIDLRRVGTGSRVVREEGAPPTHQGETVSFGTLIRKYRVFIVFMVVIITSWFVVHTYLSDVLTLERDYEVVEERADGSQILPVDNRTPFVR